MKKSEEIFNYLLKDFEPDEDYKQEWTEPVNGTRTLIRYFFKFPELEMVEHPFMVYIIFVSIKKYGILPLFEKVLWEIPILYKGHPFILAQRKFGFDISSGKNDDQSEILAKEAICLIIKSIGHAEGLVSEIIKSKVKERCFTIENKYPEIRNRYLFFREKLLEDFASDESRIKDIVVLLTSLEKKDVEGRITLHQKVERLKNFRSYYLLSMIDAFYSMLEHLTVLLIPFLSHMNNPQPDVNEFMGRNWKGKLQQILRHGENAIGAKHIEILDEIKEQIRNPASHGHFYRDGKSLNVHWEIIGAIPVTLTKSTNNFKFSSTGKSFMGFSEICRHLDEFENYLDNYDTRFAMQLIRRRIPVSFDKESILAYKKRMKTHKSTELFIKESIDEIERSMNMDW